MMLKQDEINSAYEEIWTFATVMAYLCRLYRHPHLTGCRMLAGGKHTLSKKRMNGKFLTFHRNHLSLTRKGSGAARWCSSCCITAPGSILSSSYCLSRVCHVVTLTAQAYLSSPVVTPPGSCPVCITDLPPAF